jgi:hypothetical protein
MSHGIAWRRHAVVAGCSALLLACGRDSPEEPDATVAPAAPRAASDATSALASQALPATSDAAPIADPAALADFEAILAAEAPDLDALLAAIARVGAAGDARARGALAALLLDPKREDSVRARAAVSLARVDARAASAALARLDPWVLSAALDHVRTIPFAESEALFRALLDAPLSQDAKRDAIAALGDSSEDATPLLVEIAGRDRDPALRATAVDAIAFMPDPGAAPLALVELPARERAPEVRASLYRVLARNASALAPTLAAAALLPTILGERDPIVRLEGYGLVAQILSVDDDAKLREPFDRIMVPWLAREAERGASRPARLRAVETLGLPGGVPAAQALAKLADAREPEVADAARRALSPR